MDVDRESKDTGRLYTSWKDFNTGKPLLPLTTEVIPFGAVSMRGKMGK